MKIYIGLVRGKPEESQVYIDGVDITTHVLRDGFTVQVEPGNPIVTLALRPDHLDIDVEGPAGEIIQRLRAEADTTQPDSTTSTGGTTR